MNQSNDGLSQRETSRLFGKKKPARARPQSDSAIEKVKIHSLAELKKLVNRIKPGEDVETKPIIIDTKDIGMDDETYSGDVVIPQAGSQSTVRQTILDGFEMVKNHMEYHNASMASQTSLEEYGGFPPAVAPNPNDHLMWIDFFVDRNMGGKREGLYIVWEIPEGKFRLDPWSCKLEKISVS